VIPQGGQLSPDGLYWWDGVRWVPTAGAIPQPILAAPGLPPGARLALAGGVVAILGAVVIIVACVIPFAHYTDNTSPSSPSIVNPGYPGALWYAVEPGGVILFAIAAGVALIALRSRISRALMTGALMAFGAQTALMFASYAGAAVAGPSEQVGPGGPIGVLGGLAIMVGGALAAASLGVRRPSTVT
jgi:hypothetical protein